MFKKSLLDSLKHPLVCVLFGHAVASLMFIFVIKMGRQIPSTIGGWRDLGLTFMVLATFSALIIFLINLRREGKKESSA